MSLVTFYYENQPRGKIDSIVVDVTLNDDVSYKCGISQYAVEDGSFISDHITEQPYDLSLRGLITDYPLNSAESSPVGGNRVKNAYEELLALKKNKTPFNVVTGLDVYTNVFFTTFDIHRDADTGRALSFEAKFQKITFATPVKVKIQRDKIRSGKKDLTQSDVKKGADQASNAEEKRENVSLLYKLFHQGATT